MPVGTQPSMGSINQAMTQMALTIRDGATTVLNQWAYLNNLGVAGLEAAGFDSADAQEVLNLVNYMATLAQVYKGTATQGTEFNFENALTPLWGGS